MFVHSCGLGRSFAQVFTVCSGLKNLIRTMPHGRRFLYCLHSGFTLLVLYIVLLTVDNVNLQPSYRSLCLCDNQALTWTEKNRSEKKKNKNKQQCTFSFAIFFRSPTFCQNQVYTQLRRLFYFLYSSRRVMKIQSYCVLCTCLTISEEKREGKPAALEHSLF